MTNKENGLEPKPFTCPHCKKDLPEELSFCPYCMERIKKPAVITAPTKNRNKIVFPLVALFGGVFIITLVCLVGIIFAINGNRQANTPEQKPESTTDSITEIDNNINKTEALTENGETPNKVNGTVNESNKQSNNTRPHTKLNEKENADSSNTRSTTKSDETNSHTTTPETTKRAQSSVTVAPTKVSDNTVTAEQMAGRWNKANTDLSIYNFQLSGYTSQNNGDAYTISQRFNSSGVNMNFTFNKNLESFTLTGDNVANLNSMYQLCRISLATVADDKYADVAFYNFVSSDNWEKIKTNTETKTGNFAGYKCNLTLVTHENTDQWGMTYTRYSFTLTATKL